MTKASFLKLRDAFYLGKKMNETNDSELTESQQKKSCSLNSLSFF